MVERDENAILTAEEVAGLLRLDVVTIQRELRAGRLPGYRVGKAWRIPQGPLLRTIEGGRGYGGPDPTVGIMKAEFHFSHGEMKLGMQQLISNLANEELLPREYREALLQRFAILSESLGSGDVEAAQGARFDDAFPRLTEIRSGKFSSSRIDVLTCWNDMVTSFVAGLRQVQRDKA